VGRHHMTLLHRGHPQAALSSYHVNMSSIS
jgi:hypothetical protein